VSGRRGILCLVAALLLESVSDAARAGTFPTPVPTFHSLGIYWSPAGARADRTCGVRFRPVGAADWRTALPLAFDASMAEYRGSLVELTPGTTYDIELTLSGVGQAVFQAATRSESFPIAQTVELPELASTTLTITQGGTPDGYVLYTHAPGGSATIDVQDLFDYGVVIKASYVVLRGVNVRGAHRYGVYIPQTGAYTDIVIEENDISGWGAWEGVFGASSQAGIRVKNPDVRRLVIQRNRIHHPRVDANSWCEKRDGTPDPLCDTSPSGPIAIRIVDTGGNHVIRYNEIRSDDDHYFADCIGGEGTASGFPTADSDIYGNYIERCWDNPIEAEGTDVNTRIWGNFIDLSYSPIGITPVTEGPLYIWRNVVHSARKGPFEDPPENLHGQFLKAGGGSSGKVYIYHNTLLQPAAPLRGVIVGISNSTTVAPATNMVSRNNILQVTDATQESIDDAAGVGNDYDFDLCNGQVPGWAEIHGWSATPLYDPGGPANTFYLAPWSPGLDWGALLPNFNDDFVGLGPDVGAYERGLPPLEFGVDAYRTTSRPATPGGESVAPRVPVFSRSDRD